MGRGNIPIHLSGELRLPARRVSVSADDLPGAERDHCVLIIAQLEGGGRVIIECSPEDLDRINQYAPNVRYRLRKRLDIESEES